MPNAPPDTENVVESPVQMLVAAAVTPVAAVESALTVSVHKLLAVLMVPLLLTKQERIVPSSEAVGVNAYIVSTAPGIFVKFDAPFLH